MRLIDADALKMKAERFCPNMTEFSSFEFVTTEDIDEMPTVCDIEQIRAEIKEELEESIRWGGDQLYNAALKKALEILDKYAEGVSE